jgi:hypothetical protein
LKVSGKVLESMRATNTSMCTCAVHCAERCEAAHCDPDERCVCWCHSEKGRAYEAWSNGRAPKGGG